MSTGVCVCGVEVGWDRYLYFSQKAKGCRQQGEAGPEQQGGDESRLGARGA